MGRQLAPHHLSIGLMEKQLIGRALDEGELTIRTSRMVKEYESALATYFGAKHCVALSSGTAAIHAALIAVGVGPGSEVILPPTAPIMTALPVLYQNATPVFIDNRPGVFDLDVSALRAALNPRTAAVISVPMWGYPTDEAGIREVTDAAGIPLVVDASQAHGSRRGGRLCGTEGLIGCFSTYESKLIGTGEGGFCITDDARADSVMREALNFGFPYRAGRYWPDCVRIGWNYKPNALAAALGLGQLSTLDARIERRTRVRLAIEARILGLPGVRPHPIHPMDTHNGYALVLHLEHDGLGVRTRIRKHISDAGVPSDPVRYAYRPLYASLVFRRATGYARTSCPFDCGRNSWRPPSACPNAEDLTGRVTTVPCHEALSDADVEYIFAIVREALLGEGSDL